MAALLACAALFLGGQHSGGGGGGGANAALARRPVVPLHELARRRGASAERGYRRTKDIRADLYERRLEEGEWRAARAADERQRLQRLHRELRWLTVGSDELAVGYHL